jgi:hypothetical protein
VSSRSSKREKERCAEDRKGHARIRTANDLNSPKRAKRNYFFLKTSRARRPLTFPILSLAGHAHKSTLSPSFCLFLSSHRFHPVVLEHRAGNSCSISFVPTTYDSLAIVFLRFRRRLYFLRFYSRPPGSRDFLLPRGKLESSFISVATSGDRDRNDCAGKTFKWSLVKLHDTVDLFFCIDESFGYEGNVIEQRRNQFYGTNYKRNILSVRLV